MTGKKVVALQYRLLSMLVNRFDNFESLEHELKSAKGGLPRDIWPTVSAFANTRGGWILLGLNDKTGNVEGVPNASDQLKDFYDLLRNKNKINVPVCGAEDAAIVDVDGDDVIMIRIPAVSRRDRPIYINGNPYDGTYTRGHTGDHHCSKREVDRMMAEASDASDLSILPNYTLDDIDYSALASYRRRYQTRNPGAPANAYDDTRFLRKIRAYRKDREKNVEGLTVAGLLLLGTEDAIRDWRKHHVIDVRIVSEKSYFTERWDRRRLWEGNLYGAFDSTFSLLTADQPEAFRLEGTTRVNPLEIALREALVNLLVHADYSEPESSLVIRSADGYYFRNPGNSRVPQYDLLDGDRSDPRNPELVSMFRHIGLAEEAGSGIPNIIQAWHALGYRNPHIDPGTERNEFIISLGYASFISEEDRSWLLDLAGEISEEEQLALITAKHDSKVDNATMQRITGKHRADITRMFGGLKNRGLLKSIGVGRQTYYELGKSAIHPPDTDLDKSPSSLDNIMPDLDRNLDTSRTYDAGDRDERRLDFIASRAREMGRVSSSRRDNVILDLCAVCPLTISEIARYMHRSNSAIKLAVRGLIASGRLAYLYPSEPTHPRQKYTVKAQTAQE